MRLAKENENLGLPDYIKFGIEIEAENVNYSKITKAIRNKKWHADKDMSLIDSGVECVSPVLKESEGKSVWEDVADVCKKIQAFPNDPNREVYTDYTCGGHIHFDAGILLSDPEIMKNFLRLWAESEEIVYKMCNDKNDPIRPGALEKSSTNIKDVVQTLFTSPLPEGKKVRSLKDCIEVARNVKANFVNSERKLNSVLTGAFINRNGMATPRGKEIQKQLENGNLKVGKPKSKLYRDMLVRTKLDPERYNGLNLINMGDKKKNTVEFRISNGTICPQTIKENVFLYASLIKTAVDMTKNPEQMQSKLQNFYQRDVSEEEKVDAFLNLTMDYPEDRSIYKQRWVSVKDAPVFSETKGSKRFGESFRKEDLKKVAEKVPVSKAKVIFSKIKESLFPTETKGADLHEQY